MYKYYLAERGETAEDAIGVPAWPESSSEAAECAAFHVWRYRDGCEDSWPMDIVIIDDGTETAFSVDLEWDPDFIVQEKRS